MTLDGLDLPLYCARVAVALTSLLVVFYKSPSGRSALLFAGPAGHSRQMQSGRRWQRVGSAPSAVAAAATPTDKSSSASPLSLAVIGGGVAGLACARRLAQLGMKPVVFDTGKRAPGGRAASRLWRGHVVDHAAQFVATTDPEFAIEISSFGTAKRWGHDGRFGVLSKSGYAPISDSVDRWVGTDGIGSIISAMARDVDVRQDVWIPPSNGLRRDGDGWVVAVPDGRGGKGRARFDAVVIAHNGKCADRLTSSTPASDVNALLRTNFSASLPQNPSPGSGKFTLNSIYSLLLEVPQGLMPSNFDAVFIENEPSLRWLSSNTSKYGWRDGAKEGTEAWTVLSSASFGRQHKAPQEFLEGTQKEAEVISLLLRAVERAVGLEAGAVSGAVLATKLQLWGAGLPINRWHSTDGADFVWSGAHQIGIAGDWLSSSAARASSIEAAWLSGVRLAEHVAGGGSGKTVGLELGESGGAFVPINGDFGASGSTTSAWVAEPAEDGSVSADGSRGSRGGGYGGKGGKGSRGGGGRGKQ